MFLWIYILTSRSLLCYNMYWRRAYRPPTASDTYTDTYAVFPVKCRYCRYSPRSQITTRQAPSRGALQHSRRYFLGAPQKHQYHSFSGKVYLQYLQNIHRTRKDGLFRVVIDVSFLNNYMSSEYLHFLLKRRRYLFSESIFFRLLSALFTPRSNLLYYLW